jgi:predicted enzyme related to lactoylglutathione lyase
VLSRADLVVGQRGLLPSAGALVVDFGTRIMPSPQQGVASFWLPYVSVRDCDATTSKAAALGAQVALPPLDIPAVGRIAAVVDPLGATIGLICGRLTIST